MTGMTSGKTTHDPVPYLSAWGQRFTTEGLPQGPRHSYSPRPEFDNHNTLLAEFRGVFEGGGADLYTVTELAQLWADLLDNGYDWTEEDLEVTAEEKAHARRVLGHLAKVEVPA